MKSKGLVGEFYFYQLNAEIALLVDPCNEATINFEIFKKNNSDFSDSIYRGKKTIILKETEKILPVKINNGDEYFEGLYYYVSTNK